MAPLRATLGAPCRGMDGEEEDVDWFDEKMDADRGGKFICKPLEFLTEDNPIDFIGCLIFEDAERIYFSMQPYVELVLDRFKDLLDTGGVVAFHGWSLST